MDFPQETYLPQKTICRKRSAGEIARETLVFGNRGLIVHGQSLRQGGKLDRILGQFPQDATVLTFCRPGGEPTLDETTEVIEYARTIDALWIAGIGGGSVLDLAKAAAGLYNAPHKPHFYHSGGELKKPGIPFIAVPTTAGSGAEATCNAVIINSEMRTKLSIRNPGFTARTVILDVELLSGIAPQTLSYAAMDALVQAYESYVSKKANWFTESLALKSIELIDRNIISAHQYGDEQSLAALLLGSYLCGIAFGHSRLGVIHGIAHPLGVLYDVPHGLISAVCFIPSLRLNRQAIGAKYDVMCSAVGTDLIGRVETLLSKLSITSPFAGRPLRETEKIIRETLSSGSTAANPKDIEQKDVEFILDQLFR